MMEVVLSSVIGRNGGTVGGGKRREGEMRGAVPGEMMDDWWKMGREFATMSQLRLENTVTSNN